MPDEGGGQVKKKTRPKKRKKNPGVGPKRRKIQAKATRRVFNDQENQTP